MKSASSRTPIDKQTKHRRLAICFFLALAAIPLERAIKPYLFDLSLRHIRHFRASSTPALDVFFSIVSELAEKVGFIVVNTLAFCVLSLYSSFQLMLALNVAIGYNVILKLFYCDPRPFYIDHSIVPVACDLEFGNPSGHSQASTAYYFVLARCLIREFAPLQRRSRLVYAASAALCLLIGFSRVFTGVHSYNQILFGFFCGTMSYVLMCHVYEDLYFQMIDEAIAGKYKGVKLLNNTLFRAWLASFVVGVAVYVYVARNETYFQPPEWAESIYEVCPSKRGKNMGFAFACLKKLTLAFSMPGCMFGIFFDCHFLKTGTHSFVEGNGSLL